jgi:hypothetical protein
VSIGRVKHCHYFPSWVTGVWLTLGLLFLLLSGACRRGMPLVDLGPKPLTARVTINGIVHGADGSSAIAGRTVDITNDRTGERHSVQTGANGGFTIELPAGQYRVDLPLKAGEALLKRPAPVTLDKRDVDSHVEFVVSPTRAARPHGPAYRLDNGLGAPIA